MANEQQPLHYATVPRQRLFVNALALPQVPSSVLGHRWLEPGHLDYLWQQHRECGSTAPG